MANTSNRYIVPDSERAPVARARATGKAMADERIEVSVRVRHAPGQRDLGDSDAVAAKPPARREYLSRDEFAKRHGAAAEDRAKLPTSPSAWAGRHRSECGAADGWSCPALRRRWARPSGGRWSSSSTTVAAVAAAPDRSAFPADLAGVVEDVFGLANRPQATPHFQVLGADGAAIARTPGASFTPPQLATLYDFPTGVDGRGQCIAIIRLGGGFKPADIGAYFVALNLPVPNVKAISVDGARNHPTHAQSADSEVTLDIEVAATIAVYFAPNTSPGFLDAITTAVHDSVNRPSAISISWGSAESSWTAQAMTQFDQAFQAAASRA